MPMGEAASDIVGAIRWLVTSELNLMIVGGLEGRINFNLKIRRRQTGKLFNGEKRDNV